MKRWLMVLPLAAFLVVAVFLYRGLYLDPAELPSAMIGKPFPAFSLRFLFALGAGGELFKPRLRRARAVLRFASHVQ